jgi:hypothetical protein
MITTEGRGNAKEAEEIMEDVDAEYHLIDKETRFGVERRDYLVVVTGGRNCRLFAPKITGSGVAEGIDMIDGMTDGMDDEQAEEEHVERLGNMDDADEDAEAVLYDVYEMHWSDDIFEKRDQFMELEEKAPSEVSFAESKEQIIAESDEKAWEMAEEMYEYVAIERVDIAE